MEFEGHTLTKAAAVAGGFFVFTGVVTGLLPVGVFDRMVPRAPLDYLFLVLTSLLLGVYLLQRSMLEECGGDGCAYTGGFAGFFAVACPQCNALLLLFFGSSWLATYVDPLRPLVGGVAVTLFLGVIYLRHRRPQSTT